MIQALVNQGISKRFFNKFAWFLFYVYIDVIISWYSYVIHTCILSIKSCLCNWIVQLTQMIFFPFISYSILLQFTDGYFNEKLQSTIGVDFKVKIINVTGSDGSSKKVRVTIWDTGTYIYIHTYVYTFIHTCIHSYIT